MLFLDPKKADSSLPSVAQNDTSKIVCTSILKTTPLKQKKLEWGTPPRARSIMRTVAALRYPRCEPPHEI